MPHRCAVLAVRGKYAIEARQVDPRLWHQGGEPGDEVQRLEDDMGGAIAVRRLELVADVAMGRERQALFRDRRATDGAA